MAAGPGIGGAFTLMSCGCRAAVSPLLRGSSGTVPDPGRYSAAERQTSFGAIMVGAAPEARQFDESRDDSLREAFADRAGRLMGLAAETFNDGLRAYYLSSAAVAWFFSPWAFMAATALVLWVLYRREFHSDVLVALREGLRS